MPGDLDPAYVLARTALLDAAEALAPHLDAVTEEATEYLRSLFAERDGRGVQSAIAASAQLVDPDEIALTLTVLSSDLLDAVAD